MTDDRDNILEKLKKTDLKGIEELAGEIRRDMIDAVSRLVPGVLNNEESAETESFDDGLLEYPQYSRPEIWMDKKVPPVLLSGNHANVDVWRFQKSLERTKERRPELYDKYVEEHPEQFTAKALKKRNKILDKIEENS